MVSTEEFFRTQQPAAVFKHGVLFRYAVYFAGRAGSQTQGRVSYVDGYAGPGKYDDGTPGSPFLLTQAANQSSIFGRRTSMILTEASSRLAANLQEATAGDPRATVLNEPFENVVDQVLALSNNTATLVFVDPFSIGIGFDQMTRVLAASRVGRPVDVLYHFSSQSVARLAERVVKASDDDNVQDIAARIDELMGTLEWRHAFAKKADGERSFQVATQIARRFAQSVAETASATSTTVDVRRRPGQLPIYSLSLITKDSQAGWDFTDMAGKAHIDWIQKCNADEHNAHLAGLDLAGIQTLFAYEPPSVSDIEGAITQQVIPYLIDRIPRLLASGPVRFADDPELILGDEHGRARSMHVRAALKTLYKQRVIDTDGTGDFFTRPVALAE